MWKEVEDYVNIKSGFFAEVGLFLSFLWTNMLLPSLCTLFKPEHWRLLRSSLKESEAPDIGGSQWPACASCPVATFRSRASSGRA